MDLDYASAHKHAIEELGQYPAILTSHLVNNPYVDRWKLNDVIILGDFNAGCGHVSKSAWKEIRLADGHNRGKF